ncbi:acyl carrier protein [bacterium]|nr:acyl carrier protein [bacterium]
MDDTTIYKIKEILSKHTKMAIANMPDDLLLENTAIDSLGMMEVMFDFEDEFNIEIPEPETIEERNNLFRTIGDVVGHIESIIQQKHKAA